AGSAAADHKVAVSGGGSLLPHQLAGSGKKHQDSDCCRLGAKSRSHIADVSQSIINTKAYPKTILGGAGSEHIKSLTHIVLQAAYAPACSANHPPLATSRYKLRRRPA